MDIAKKEQIEIDYWRTSEYEKPDKFSEENFKNKISDSKVFEEAFSKYENYFEKADVILETGAGQGWASCIIKEKYPDKKIITTDISKYAIESLKYWEEKFNVKIDDCFPAKSYEIPVSDSSINMIFCFSSAHHYLLFYDTLREVKRVLTDDGVCLWLYEPASPSLFYRIIKRRLNNNRQVVPEDVLVLKKLRKMASELDLNLKVDYFPSVTKRGKTEKIYFTLLKRFPLLNRILPSTVNVVIAKK